MRYGLMIDTAATPDQALVAIERAAELGMDFAAVPQVFGADALTLLAVAGTKFPDIGLATAVVPTYPRHPLVMAAQALTVQALAGDRLTLGIGLSHQIVIEQVYGDSYDKPARHMREYLSVLLPALAGEQVSFQGQTMSASTFGPLAIEAPRPRVLLAALAPRMLELAGSLADGTSTWMVGPRTLAEHIAPSLQVAADKANRPSPSIAVQVPVCVTDDPDGARQRAGQELTVYGFLPSYRAMLDREGVEGPGDIAVVGSADSVREQLAVFAAAGATELGAVVFGSRDEVQVTNELMSSLAKG